MTQLLDEGFFLTKQSTLQWYWKLLWTTVSRHEMSSGLHGKNNDLNIQDISLLISGVLCELAMGLM